jgi:hypothetical protein
MKIHHSIATVSLLMAPAANAQSPVGKDVRQYKSGMCPMTSPNEVGNALKARVIFYAYPDGPANLIQPADLTLLNGTEVMENASVDKALPTPDGLAFSGSKKPGRVILNFSSRKYGGPNDKSGEWALIFRGQGEQDDPALSLVGPCIFKFFKDRAAAIKATRNNFNLVMRGKK